MTDGIAVGNVARCSTTRGECSGGRDIREYRCASSTKSVSDAIGRNNKLAGESRGGEEECEAHRVHGPVLYKAHVTAVQFGTASDGRSL